MRVASIAIGLSTWIGKARMRPSVTIWSISQIICCARPTANAGISSTPPRAKVFLSTPSSWSTTEISGCVRLP